MILERVRSQEIRFVVVGAYNTAFGIAVYLLLFGLLENHFHYMLLLTVNYVLGTLNGFLAYKFLVFRSSAGYFWEYLRFNTVHLAGIVVNYIALPILVEIVRLTPFAAQGMIIAVLIVMSYILHKHFTFRHKSDATKVAAP